jgi:hypothetical protein
LVAHALTAKLAASAALSATFFIDWSSKRFFSSEYAFKCSNRRFVPASIH